MGDPYLLDFAKMQGFCDADFIAGQRTFPLTIFFPPNELFSQMIKLFYRKKCCVPFELLELVLTDYISLDVCVYMWSKMKFTL